MPSAESIYRIAPPRNEGDRGDARDDTRLPVMFRHAPNSETRSSSVDAATSPSIDQLIRPTWAEVDQAREQYEKDAKRLRYWQRWFFGMFTVYTALVGILLLRLFVGQ